MKCFKSVEALPGVSGSVLANNARMLEMCKALSFKISADPEGPSLRKVRLKLPAPIQNAA